MNNFIFRIMKLSKQQIAQLKQLEESLWTAKTRFDLKYMNQTLAPDFFEFGRSGRIHTRKAILAAPPETINAKFPLKNFKVHTLTNDVFLITYISEVKYGNKIELANRSSIWIKTPESWRLRFHQGTATQK